MTVPCVHGWRPASQHTEISIGMGTERQPPRGLGAQGLLQEGWAHCRPPSPPGLAPLLLWDQAGEELPCEVLSVQCAFPALDSSSLSQLWRMRGLCAHQQAPGTRQASKPAIASPTPLKQQIHRRTPPPAARAPSLTPALPPPGKGD